MALIPVADPGAVDYREPRPTTAAHRAGVLAHGLAATAVHVASYSLPVLRISGSPTSAEDGRPAVDVQVFASDVEVWLPTVHLDETTRQHAGRVVQVMRRCRLRDSGVVVTLISIERAGVTA